MAEEPSTSSLLDGIEDSLNEIINGSCGKELDSGQRLMLEEAWRRVQEVNNELIFGTPIQ